MIKYLIALVFLLMIDPPLSSFNEIARTNALIKKANESLASENFAEAANHFRVLVDSFGMDDSQLKLNLAHALLKSGNQEDAEKIYQNTSGSTNRIHRSIANQQLGNLAIQAKDLDKAISYYKSALKADPQNEEARYNYELALKLKENQQEEDPEGEDEQEQQQDKDQQEEDEEEQQEEGEEGEEDQKEQEKGEESEETGEEEQQEGEAENESEKENENPDEQQDQQQPDMQNLKEKLEEMNMNEETAMMILEALRNKEIQYLQQMRKKSTQNRKSGKPDW